jgi:hypothetical protein
MVLTGKRHLSVCAATFIAFGLAARTAAALDGGQSAAPRHFGVVGSIASSRASIGQGFSAVQIAPRWVLTASHVAPQPGAIFADDFGISGVAEVLPLATRAPTVSPIPGAMRDDLVLVRLAAPIQCPYYPQLADEALLPHGPWLAGFATLVSNNPALNHRRFGASAIELTGRIPGYSFAVSVSDTLRLVSGDSGSAMFLGRLSDTDASSVLLGIASSQLASTSGAHMGVYTRVGAYRPLLDQAVFISGEHLRWAESLPPAPSR